MKIMKSILQPIPLGIALIAAGNVYAAPARVENLCRPDEVVLFQCKLKTRLLSLCASKDISPTAGKLQYRFGTPQKIELTYPKTPQSAAGNFFISAVIYPGGDETHIRFNNKGFDYILFDKSVRTESNGNNNPKLSSGAVIRRDGKISALNCLNNASMTVKVHGIMPTEEFDYVDQQ